MCTKAAGGGGGGAGLSDIAAEGVTETPSAGTGTDASRWDHEHDIPFNSTLEWDTNSQFGVRVQDVIEHLPGTYPVLYLCHWHVRCWRNGWRGIHHERIPQTDYESRCELCGVVWF